MQRHVAFLRAINVGGRRVLKERLISLFEDLGFSDVDTFLASGNVVFDAPGDSASLEAKIEAHLEDALGYTVATFVRTMAELGEIPQSSIFEAEAKAPNHKRYVAFLKRALTDEQTRELDDLANEIDAFAVDGRELYWLRAVDAGESMSTGDIEKTLGVQATRRTFRTVERLVGR